MHLQQLYRYEQFRKNLADNIHLSLSLFLVSGPLMRSLAELQMGMALRRGMNSGSKLLWLAMDSLKSPSDDEEVSNRLT